MHELDICCRFGEVEDFNELINNEQFTQDDLNDALYEAVDSTKIEPKIINMLLNKGANPNFRKITDYSDTNNYLLERPILSKLIHSLEIGSKYSNEIISNFLKHGADIHADGDHAGYVASQQGNVEVLKMLHNLNAVNSKDIENGFVGMANMSKKEFYTNGYRNRLIETMDFMIAEMNMQFSDSTKTQLSENGHDDMLKKINSRDLAFDFDQRLPVKQGINQKMKMKI